MEHVEKTLLLVEREPAIERWVYEASGIPRDRMVVLQSYGPLQFQPYDGFMRNVLLAIYYEGIKAITVIGTEHRHMWSEQSSPVAAMQEQGVQPSAFAAVSYLMKHVIFFQHFVLKRTYGTLKPKACPSSASNF